MKSKNVENYENVIVRNQKEIGINNYGLDYLVNLEQKIYKVLEIVKLCDTKCSRQIIKILGDDINDL